MAAGMFVMRRGLRDESSNDLPSPSLSCTGIGKSAKPAAGKSRTKGRLTKREKASLNSETCSSVRESACLATTKSAVHLPRTQRTPLH